MIKKLKMNINKDNIKNLVIPALILGVSIWGCCHYYYTKKYIVAMKNNYVFLQGGLANQMRQYMFGKYIASKFGCQVKFISFFPVCGREYSLWPFNLDISFAPRSVLSKNLNISFAEPYWYFGKNFVPKNVEKKFPKKGGRINISAQTDAYFWSGPWKSGFENMRAEFIKDFKLKIPLDEANNKMLKKIQDCNSISVHVRRTDFIPLHLDAPLDSYYKAIEYIAAKVKDPHFFVFSDDIEWCKKNLKLKYPITFVDINDSLKGYLDLELMKNCKHNIKTDNSTFSHMGAWLNENPDKIVLDTKDFR